MTSALVAILALALGYVLGRRRKKQDLYREAEQWAYLVRDQILYEAKGQALESFAVVMSEYGDQFAVPVRVAEALAEQYRREGERVGKGGDDGEN